MFGGWDGTIGIQKESGLEIDFLRQESVNSALDLVETCPTACAFVLSIARFSGAGPAADRTIACVMQWIVRNSVVANVVPDRLTGPVCHRIEFDDVTVHRVIQGVELNDPNRRAGFGLLATEPGDPAIDLGQFPLQRQNFASRAAQVRVLLPKGWTVDCGLLFNREIRNTGLDLVSEELLESLLERNRLGKQQAGVQGENRK